VFEGFNDTRPLDGENLGIANEYLYQLLGPEIAKTQPSGIIIPSTSLIYDTAWQSLGQKSPERYTTKNGYSCDEAPWPANTPAGHSINNVQAHPKGLHTLDGASRRKPIDNAQSRLRS
jgi:hypothetical protein